MSRLSDNKDPITILSVCSSYPRHESDSASIFLRNLNNAIDKSRFRLVVITPDHEQVSDNISDPGIEIVRFRYFSRKYQLLTYGSGILPNIKKRPYLVLLVPFFLSSMFLTLVKIIRTEKPKLIHAHWIVPQGLISVLTGRWFSIPVIVTAHGGDAFAFRGRLSRLAKHWTLKKCSAWTANTRMTAAAIDPQSEYNEKLHLVPMGIDVHAFSKPAPPPAGISRNGDYIILFVGRLVAKKGAVVLIRAFGLLPTHIRAKCQLWIIGDGSERGVLEDEAKNLKLQSGVRFLGEISNPDLPSYYRAADLFVVPSIVESDGDTEGQGVVILEAMASGVPVLASNVGGIPDVIQNNKTGFLFNPGDAGGLAKIIGRFVTDPTLQKSTISNALESVQKQYDISVTARAFESLYAEHSTGTSVE